MIKKLEIELSMAAHTGHFSTCDVEAGELPWVLGNRRRLISPHPPTINSLSHLPGYTFSTSESSLCSNPANPHWLISSLYKCIGNSSIQIYWQQKPKEVVWRSSVSLTTSVSRGSAGPGTEVLSPRLISALGCSTEPSSSTIFLSLQPDSTPSSFSRYTAALFGPLWSPESLTVSVCTAGDIFTLKIPLARLQPEYWILKVLPYLVISKQYIVGFYYPSNNFPYSPPLSLSNWF